MFVERCQWVAERYKLLRFVFPITYNPAEILDSSSRSFESGSTYEDNCLFLPQYQCTCLLGKPGVSVQCCWPFSSPFEVIAHKFGSLLRSNTRQGFRVLLRH